MAFYQDLLLTLLRGAVMTVALSICAMVLGLALGLIIALGRLSPNRFVSGVAYWYVEAFRGTPLLVQLFLIYYGLPEFGIRLPAFVAGVLGLGLNYAAYLAEVYRGGITSINKGQWEAGMSIGMSRPQIMREIILPQAIRVVIPPVGNYFISMLKDSALTSTITVYELLRAGQLKVALTLRSFEIYLMVAVVYFCLSYPVSRLVQRVEVLLAGRD